MKACTACGHEPVTGSFCPACGAGASAEPVDPGTVPQPPRYPLYADDVATSASPVPLSGGSEDREAPPIDPVSHAGQGRSAGPLPWIAGIGVVLVLGLVGGALLFLGGGDDNPQAVDPAPSADGDGEAPEDSPAKDEQSDDTAGETGAGTRLVPGDVDVPGAAGASTDNAGNRVTYDAGNLLDNDPRTTWRVAGDASGDVVTFRFDDPVALSEVGLINGYAKQDPPNDWYLANRRVLEAEWEFGDGTTVTQELDESRTVQSISVDAGETDVVRLRIVRVSPPGGRDYTALSEVVLTGSGG